MGGEGKGMGGVGVCGRGRASIEITARGHLQKGNAAYQEGMRIIREKAKMRAAATGARGPVVLVPTMGALHSGHAALVRLARDEAGQDGTVVVSIFVNPTQFGPSEDFESYPRDLDRDAALVAENGGDIVFAPGADEMYARDRSVAVDETLLSRGLCGASRPGHFAGVCLVVIKLFNIVRPGVAVFGKKDYQQLAIIRRVVRDLDLPVRIVGGETVRLPSGLAMSSRNRYLSAQEQVEAASIRRALLDCRDAGLLDATALVARFREMLAIEAPLGRIDYVEVVGADDLQPLAQLDRPALMAAAVFFGTARLIDNIEIAPV